MRTLVAGFGNPLRGDDGFGVAVVQLLQRTPLRADVTVIDVGTGGIHLAHELLSIYDRVIIVDAMQRGDPPGTLHVLEVEQVEPEASIDLHLVLPARALGVAKALGVLPASVLLIGCEPAIVDELTLDLSPAVQAALEPAVEKITEILTHEAVAEGAQ